LVQHSAGAEADLEAAPRAATRHAGLDLLRALAIALTCLMHFVWVIGAWRYQRDFELFPISAARSVDEGIWMWLYHSQHGVYLFFVLSGFLLTSRWFAQSPPTLARYLRDRALRTLPGAWLAISVALILLAVAGKAPADAGLRWLENAFFLNWFRSDDTHHLLIVTWSLQAEWIFYLLLPVVWFLAMRVDAASRTWIVLLIGLATMVVLKFCSLRGGAYALFFTTGALCALEQHRWRPLAQKISWRILVLTYVLVNFAYAWTTPTAARLQTSDFGAFEMHAVAFSAIAGLLLLKVASHTFAQTPFARLGLHIGRISYSVYLWNLLVVLVLGQVLGLPGRLDTLPAPLAITLYLALCVVVTWPTSLLSFVLVEQPYFNRRGAHTKIGT
jgi:exopolysaccharide production protein ExoZ